MFEKKYKEYVHGFEPISMNFNLFTWYENFLSFVHPSF